MIDLNELAKECYMVALSRGQLDGLKTMESLKNATADKVKEETGEFRESKPSFQFTKDSEQSEISDIIMTLLTYSHGAGYDIESNLMSKLRYNRKRMD